MARCCRRPGHPGIQLGAVRERFRGGELPNTLNSDYTYTPRLTLASDYVRMKKLSKYESIAIASARGSWYYGGRMTLNEIHGDQV